MKAFKLITLTVLMVGLMASFAAFGAEKTKSQDKQKTPTTLTPTTTIKSTKKKTLTGTLSDIKVDRVWLDDQGQINFKLRNSGKQTMSTSEHNQGVVRVYFGKGHEDFFLTKKFNKDKAPVDPKGALKKPGRTVSYKTNITLGKQGNVKVTVIKESKAAALKTFNSKAFLLTPTKKGKTAPKTRPIEFERGHLTVISPGRGGEHFPRDHFIRIVWRFYPGTSGVMPRNWVVTIMSWDTASGYSDVLSMNPRTSASPALPFGEREHEEYWEYTFPWDIPEDFPAGNYKVRVQGGRWEGEGSLLFTIGRSWNVTPSWIRLRECDLIVYVMHGTALASGACDFRVELLNPSSRAVLQSWVAHSRLEGSRGTEDVNLGYIGGRLREVDCCSLSERCSVLIRVTVDSTNRIIETNESDNIGYQEICCPSCWGARCP